MSITIEESQPIEQKSDEQPSDDTPKIKKKKTVKKVKNISEIDGANLIQKLIDEDIPSSDNDSVMEVTLPAPDLKTVKKKKPKRAKIDDDEPVVSTVLDEEGTNINLIAEANVLLKSLANYKKVDDTMPLPEPQSDLDEDQPDDTTSKKIVKRKVIKKPKKQKSKDDSGPQIPEEQEIIELSPMPIIEKQQKPTQVTTCTVEDLPKVLAKLRKPSKKKKETKPTEETAITFRLKSRITPMEYPPAIFMPKITQLKTVRGKGELSRNIEEALKVLKRRKIKKFKPTEYETDSLEKVDSELSENSEESTDLDSTNKDKYQRESKDAPEDELHKAPIKLGKGKHKPQIDDAPEQIKLKPVKKKKTPKNKEDQIVGEPQQATIIPSDEQTVDTEYNLEPIAPFDSAPIDRDLEEYEKSDEIPSDENEKDDTKPKYKRKKKKKPDLDESERKIVKGIPKPQEIPSDDDLNLQTKQKPVPQTSVEDVVLKPFESPADEQTIDKSDKPKSKPKKKTSKTPKDSPDDEHDACAIIDDDITVINISELPEDTEHKHTDTIHKIHPPHFEQITQIDEPGKIPMRWNFWPSIEIVKIILLNGNVFQMKSFFL